MKKKKPFTYREIIAVILLALLVTACFRSVINPLTEGLLSETEITIRRTDHIPGRHVTILYEEYAENEDELFGELEAANEQKDLGWYFEQGVPGESWTMLEDAEGCRDLSIPVKVTPRKYLTFLVNRGAGEVEISTGEGTMKLDLYRDQDESEILRVYPFAHSTRSIVIRMGLYGVFGILVLSLLFGLIYLIKYGPALPDILLKPVGKWDYVVCAGLFFAVGVFLLKVIGIPNYLQVGDETAYWNTNPVRNGRLDLDYLSSLFALRGYWCYIPQNLVRYLGNILSLDARILWILFVAIVWSIFTVGIFPGIYGRIGKREPLRIHLIGLVAIMLTTWRHYLTSVLMDGFGMITFFAFLYFCIRLSEGERVRLWALLAGFFASVSCNFRVANLYGIAGAVLFLLIKANRKEKRYKQTVEGVAVFAMAFVLVCVPQFIVNLNRGHVGLLPHDDYSWMGRSVVTWGSDYAMASGNIAYPLLATDDQMLTMKDQLYSNDTPLSMEQLLDIYMNSPVETLMLMAKKLLIGFDIKTNIAHPGDGAVPWRETTGMLFSLWNYFLLFSGLYALVKSRRIMGVERWMTAMMAILLILPETFVKIEWRYLIAGYFMIYYFFAFFFLGTLGREREERVRLLEKSNYLFGLVAFMFAYLTMSFLFLA